jgi:hypothetical protein
MIHSIISKVLLCFSAVGAGVGLIFLVLALKRSMLPYNSEGNYFDGVVNYHEQSVFVYGILACASFSVSMILFAVRLFFRRLRQADPIKRSAFVEPSS